MFTNIWEEDGEYRFVIHLHEAKRAGKHYDLRIENKNRNELVSFASRKIHLLIEGFLRRIMLIMQPLHSVFWLNFSGYWKGGYGEGRYKIFDNGIVKIEDVNPVKVVLNFRGKKIKGKYAIIHMSSNKYFLFIKVKR